MAKRKSPTPSFMKYAGSMSGPPDLSSRHGFERARERQIDSVYLLYHLRKDDPESDTQLLLIGAYRSEGDAKAAIERLKSKPGFARHPDGFEYHAYALGVENWSEGF